MKKQVQFSIWYFVIGLVLLVAIQDVLNVGHDFQLNYSDFKKALVARQVVDIVVEKENVRGSITTEGLKKVLPTDQVKKISASGSSKHSFSAPRVEDPDLIRDLQAAQVSFAGKIELTWFAAGLSWLIPAAFIFAIWFFLLQKMGASHGGMMSIGKSKAKVYVENDIKTDFEHVAGVDEAVEELREVVAFLKMKAPERFTRLGGRLQAFPAYEGAVSHCLVPWRTPSF
jgi:cell division protease FtsH